MACLLFGPVYSISEFAGEVDKKQRKKSGLSEKMRLQIFQA